MGWTKEQQQVITLRERNLLIAAAAGSGKTAVLVERIIQKIMNQEQPVDIDRLLIVTFTNAAAAEMRERIGAAIEKALEEQPDNAHLQRQQSLLHNAQITTIHSFCLYVIRNYFHRIDLDPDFRVAEEGELKLLKSDVLDQVLEICYQKAEPAFLTLSETIATGKNDMPLKETVLKLYEFAMSYPWPKQWLLDCRKTYAVENEAEFQQQPLVKELELFLKELAQQWHRQIVRCYEISMEPEGPDMYAPMLEQEAEGLKRIAECESYGAYASLMGSFGFGRLAAARKFNGDPGKKEYVQKMRNEVKASMKKITQQFFFQSVEDTCRQIQKNKPVVDMLIQVTLDFMEAFGEKKREKNMLDFNDLEHFALKILVEEETREPAKTALELQKKYEEIMIDEYQDSNYVQETILKAVSGEGKGRHNIFMVGDVKQSIYRFRMARPELFMEKYNTYTLTESKNQRIDLHKNFRSRPQVLTTVNDIFRKIMNSDIGNITYDDQAALYPGAEFPEGEPGMFDTKILVIEPESEKQDVKDRELEARAAGIQIKEMMEKQLVTDKETGELRQVRYSDMVILLRSMGSWADTFLKVLGEMGIPVRAASGTGYFSAAEVQTALHLLKVIDNPRQDIPMAAVLSSPIAGLEPEDLAVIRTRYPKEKFYQAVAACAAEEDTPGLKAEKKKKLQDFMVFLNRYRNKVCYTPIHELLYELLEETGYLSYVYALPGGEVKRANLEMLVEKAIAYENTSYRGLFHFIRYMEQLQKYDVDFAVADGEEQEDLVSIMTIHKSKGLEFPVVFVSGLGKMFNTQDIREKLVLHPQLGIGLDDLDIQRRIRIPGITRQFLARKVSLENTGEELRVLYVALTRAKEKLVLTGTMKKAEEKLEALKQAPVLEDGCLSFLTRMNTNTFLQFILQALVCYGEKYTITRLGPKELEHAQLTYAVREELTKLELAARVTEPEEIFGKQIEERLAYVYPYEEEEDMRTKVSVSEIKHRVLDRMMAEETEEPVKCREGEPEEHYVPAFMEGIQEENTGARRGTAMHRVLECYDFVQEPCSMKQQLSGMQERGLVQQEMLELVNQKALKRFLESPLAKRMQKAAAAGKLYREKPFVMGEPAKKVLEGSESEEMILIQGIIDVFFEENNEMVLLDYKTDRIREKAELADRYRAQIELYQKAIERATGKQVRERLLYSFCLDDIVEV